MTADGCAKMADQIKLNNGNQMHETCKVYTGWCKSKCLQQIHDIEKE